MLTTIASEILRRCLDFIKRFKDCFNWIAEKMDHAQKKDQIEYHIDNNYKSCQINQTIINIPHFETNQNVNVVLNCSPVSQSCSMHP